MWASVVGSSYQSERFPPRPMCVLCVSNEAVLCVKGLSASSAVVLVESRQDSYDSRNVYKADCLYRTGLADAEHLSRSSQFT
jgi:hypothetical protein